MEEGRIYVDDYHWHTTQGRAPEQTLAPTEIVRDVEAEDDHSKGLGDAIEPRCEKLEVGAGNPKSCKYPGRVVGDNIDTSHVLTPTQ